MSANRRRIEAVSEGRRRHIVGKLARMSNELAAYIVEMDDVGETSRTAYSLRRARDEIREAHRRLGGTMACD